MKTIKLITESNKYNKGERINLVTIETTTNLADDIAALANYYGTLSVLQTQLDNLNEKSNPNQQEIYDKEIARVISEMDTMGKAIEIQNQYIKGFDNNEV